jgi:hypothetical protein
MRRRPRYSPAADWRQWVRFRRVLSATGDLGVLDGSGLHRYTALTGQPNPFTSATLVWRLRNMDNSRRNVIVRGWDQLTVNATFSSATGSINDTNGPQANFQARDDGAVLQFNTGLQGWVAGPDEALYAASVDGTSGKMQGWIHRHGWREGDNLVGGVIPTPIVYPTPAMMNSADQWELFGLNYFYGGDAALVWLAMASDSSAFVDLSVASTRRMLENDPSTWTGMPTPLIWFQGDAAHWNSGVNRGTGGDFLVKAGTEVTDA